MSSDPNWPSRYSHPTRAAKRANLAEKVAWALKDAQAEIDSLTVLLGQAQKDRDEFARAEDRERTRAECALVALAAAEARADRLTGVDAAARGLFDALDYVTPGWRADTCVVHGDEVNRAWFELEKKLGQGPDAALAEEERR